MENMDSLEKDMAVHRELVYTLGLVKVLRRCLEDGETASIPVLAQVDAISDKLVAIDGMMDMKKFAVGDRVMHESFGEGTVRRVDEDSYAVKFDATDTVRNIMFRFKGLHAVEDAEDSASCSETR